MADEKQPQSEFSGLRTRAEKTLSSRQLDNEEISALTSEEIQSLVHELRVHQIELEMQNDDLRQAQTRLEELKDKYKDLYDFAPVGYVTLNERGLILEANLTAVRLLGIERRNLINTYFARFLSQQDSDLYYLYLQRVMETQSKRTCEIKIAGSDGLPFYGLLETIVLQDDNGQFKGFRTALSDISERKLAEEEKQALSTAILEEKEKLSSLIDSMIDEVWFTDTHRSFTVANAAAVKEFCLTGNTGIELDYLATNLEVLRPDGTVRPIDEAPPLLALAGKSVKNSEEIVRTPASGELRHRQVSSTPVKDANGCIIGAVSVVRDITDRKRVQEELLEAKRNWEDTFNSINDIVTIHDKDFNIIRYNAAAKRLLGLPDYTSADEIKCYKYYHGRDCPPAECPSCRCLETLKEEVFEFFEPHLNMFVEVRAIPRLDNEGQFTGLVHIVRDISDRTISEKLLHTRLALLEYSATHSLGELLQRTLDEIGSLTNSSLGFYHFISEDEQTIYLQAWSTRTMKEFCTAEGAGQHYPVDMAGVWVDALKERRTVIHNDYDSLAHKRGVPKGHAVLTRELVVPIMRSNRIVAILGIGNKPTDFSEKDVEIVSYLADVAWEIAARKQAEEALRESEKQYRTLFENSIDGVYSVLRDGTVTDANPSFSELFGYTRKEMIGKNIRELYFDPADRPRFQESIEQKGFVKDYEVKLRKRDGAEIDCLITSSVIAQENGTITGYRGIVRDLTRRKELQRQLLQAQKMESIGTLAGGIAHDFNNLLQVTLGYSELLLRDKTNKDPEYADLQKMLHAARSGAELVKRLLLFSRKTEPKLVLMKLNEQIVQVEELLRRTIPKMVEIHLDLSPDLPDIYADHSQMEQVLMNLALNARDAMPKAGTLTVRTAKVILDEEYCRIHVEAIPGEHILLEVSDTGFGMDKETIAHIFEPFFTTKEMGRGTGLGLAMVYGIIKQHNGHITVTSEVNKGTTFKVYFPVKDGEVKADVDFPSATPGLGNETILLVDDEEFVLEFGSRILIKNGYTVLHAKNGIEALDVFLKERSRISLVILDLIMPGMGGIECLKELLTIDPQVNILVASGYSADASDKECVELGAKGFVAKPFRVKELLQEARKILDTAQTSRKILESQQNQTSL